MIYGSANVQIKVLSVIKKCRIRYTNRHNLNRNLAGEHIFCSHQMENPIQQKKVLTYMYVAKFKHVCFKSTKQKTLEQQNTHWNS